MTIIPPNESIEFLKRYSADLRYECPVTNCRARRGEPCRNTPSGKVHESRRITRLQAEAEGHTRQQ